VAFGPPPGVFLAHLILLVKVPVRRHNVAGHLLQPVPGGVCHATPGFLHQEHSGRDIPRPDVWFDVPRPCSRPPPKNLKAGNRHGRVL
jgi:hypothetical protein